MHRGHADHKREEIVDDRVEAAVAQEPPRQVCHALELVVDVQLRGHEDEAERVHESLQRMTAVQREGGLIQTGYKLITTFCRVSGES